MTDAMTAGSDRGRVALVTGAAGGLGPSCCLALADLGMHVVVSDIDPVGAGKVCEQLVAEGADASWAAVNVSDRTQVDALVAKQVAVHGAVDVVVNLAGVMRNSTITHVTDDDFDLTLATHLKGVLNTVRAAVKPMRANGYGRIVNMSSVAVRGSIAGASYGAAKGGIEALSRSVAMELAPHGITVNCVAPGLVDAGMFRTVPEEYQAQAVGRTAIGRAADPREIAACVAFFASAASSYVTGQTLFACGGLTIGF